MSYSFDWSRALDPAYLFGYGIYKGAETLYNVHPRGKSFQKKADWNNKMLKKTIDIYNDTSLDAYEYRERHSEDPIIGYWWRKANNRDYYAEKKKYQEDLKGNSGYNWKDNAYPRIAYGNAFGNSGTHKSPIFEVNDAVMSLYNGVRKW